MKSLTILRNASGFAFGTAISRVLGFIREVMFAYLFGATLMMDAFRVAFRIPNLLRDLLAEGTLTPSFLPVFSDYHTKQGKDAACKFVALILGAMLVITGGITIVGILFAPQWVKLISFGFTKTPEKYWLTVNLTKLMFPFLMFITISAIFMGILNFFNHFFTTGVAPCWFNLGIIGCGILLSKRLGIQSIAIGALLGGVFQLAYQLPLLYKEGYATLPKINFNQDVKRVLNLMLPIAIGYGASKINTIVNTLIASFLGHGVISWLGYAFELMFIPVGVIGVAIANVTLPLASKEMSKQNIAEFKSTLRVSLLYGALGSIIVAIMLCVFATPICKIIYQRGNFTPQDTIATALALKFYCLGIPGLVVARILATGFYALKDTKTPMVATFITVVVNAVASVLLVGGVIFELMGFEKIGGFKGMGYNGIPFAFSISNLVNAIILGILFKKFFSLDKAKN